MNTSDLTSVVANRPDSSPHRGEWPHTEGWWRTAVIYEVYIRSFADGNGDGTGDLAGVRSRLGHLADLGVDALWITPFYPSPLADGGYDVADYRDIAPEFGDLAEFDALLADAHAHGLRVIIDIVPNHTSDQHPWFRDARAAAPGDPARERYVFRPGRGANGEEPPNNWESVFGGPAWSRVTDADGEPEEWYLHLFAPEQPDLNWRNPEVRAEFADVLHFWLRRGVDGIRVDVAHGLFKAEGLPDTGRTRSGMLDSAAQPYWDQDEVHEVYREWREILDSYGDDARGERIGVVEAWVPSLDRAVRYVRPGELHQSFNFEFLVTDYCAAAFQRVIDATLTTFGEVGAPPAWVLSNHDVVRHVTRYGGGVLGRARARVATLVMLALPGAAYLYQGEELGLEEVTDLPEEALRDPRWHRSGYTERGRDGCRVPMPWSGGAAPFGFGEGEPWLPMPRHWADHTVARQRTDTDSTLRLYRDALRLRRQFAPGDTLSWLDAPQGVLAFTTNGGLVCTANMGDDPAEIPTPGLFLLASREVSVGVTTTTLPPNTAVWWRAATTTDPAGAGQ
ncbi:glycoside hydrolase family 13 protein [Spiractinospora alimapuensis]|uniref:glycoside hydrolase family 13 protein n=1 Tax=Spiractinospora alimapuensis TaxID=2820884 RepID=UPI001F34EF29|nr:glycoside hydrolase family 13 protein [Spiractinospora alimapuensis]QVQ52884.1 glycoside hydrolase family 13 protein [Spiractinospora alimapuensis]